MRLVLASIVLISAAPNEAAAAALGQGAPAREAGTRSPQPLRIPLRDGVELAAELVLPAGAGRSPTILVRTPYERAGELESYARFVALGYALVVESVRGRAQSGGEFVPWIHERKDGFDTVEWIARQPWSDGRVGMIGASYLAQVQWAAAAEAPPALRCIVPIVSGTDHFLDVPFDHGILKLRMLPWAFAMDRREPRSHSDEFPDALWKTLPLARLDTALFGEEVAIWDRWLRCDSASAWDGANFLADAARAAIPALHVSGWWDGELGATMRNYATMHAAGRADQLLVLGPWPHAFNRTTSFGGVEYGPQAILDLDTLFERWFARWLRDEAHALDGVPRVQAFVTGANEWRGLEAWPAPDGATLALQLDSSSPLEGVASFGFLSREQARGGGPDGFTYDPARVHERFTDDTVLRLDDDAKDALYYESDPLEEAVELGGPARLELHASTSAHDMDLFALLLDVDESGEARAITGPGKMRLRYLGGWDAPMQLEPGRVYALTIELPPCAHRFAPGHQIALFLCSDWFPDFERNLNTGEPIETATRIEVATQRVYHDRTHPSVLRLPLLPARTATAK